MKNARIVAMTVSALSFLTLAAGCVDAEPPEEDPMMAVVSVDMEPADIAQDDGVVADPPSEGTADDIAQDD